MRLACCLLSVAVVVAPDRAEACLSLPPAVVRSVQPADGASGVPTSVRVRVTYATGATGQPLCGAPPPAPLLRAVSVVDGGSADTDAGASLADAGAMAADAGLGFGDVDAGIPVDGGATVAGGWVLAQDADPRIATVWEFRPSAPLQPNTQYELVDPYPETCSCVANQCVPRGEEVFARFTTRAGDDAVRPTFSGLDSLSCSHEICGVLDNNCCPPFNHLRIDFNLASAATDDVELVGVHLYVRKEGDSYDFSRPVGNSNFPPLAYADPQDGDPAPLHFNTPLSTGKYYVIARAFDTSGNEDQNLRESTFTLPLTLDPLCSQVLDASVHDNQIPSDLSAYGFNDLSGSGDLSNGGGGGGCHCTVASRTGSGGGAPTLALLAGLLAALFIRRARRRSRRAAPGAGG